MKCRILIVEDERAIRDTYKFVLEDEGYEVVTAENGKDALAQLKSGGVPPQLILLDLMMPVMNGREFLAARRLDPALAGIPVVAITCAADTTLPDGALEIVDKPMDIGLLTDIIRKYCVTGLS